MGRQPSRSDEDQVESLLISASLSTSENRELQLEDTSNVSRQL